jgi:aryl-alcohol dehydrogenase-like predicted oxidoreductase
VFGAALAREVAIIARVPLASGLLTGKFSAATEFPADDHRTFNRAGERFDQGETLSGVPFEVGLAAVERLRPFVPAGLTMAQAALRWILTFDAVTCTIPGARTAQQARENAGAADHDLPAAFIAAARDVYDSSIRAHVHGRW